MVMTLGAVPLGVKGAVCAFSINLLPGCSTATNQQKGGKVYLVRTNKSDFLDSAFELRFSRLSAFNLKAYLFQQSVKLQSETQEPAFVCFIIQSSPHLPNSSLWV